MSEEKKLDEKKVVADLKRAVLQAKYDIIQKEMFQSGLSVGEVVTIINTLKKELDSVKLNFANVKEVKKEDKKPEETK